MVVILGVRMYNKFINYLFKEDITWTLLGLKGKGKTNVASVLVKEAVDRGFTVFTNIHFFSLEQIPTAIAKGLLAKRHDGKSYKKIPPEVVVVSSMKQLLLELCSERRKVTILDEAGIHADSSVAMGHSTRTIKQLNRVIRHFDSSFGLITQTKGSIPPDLREKGIDVETTVVRKREGRYLECGKRSEYRDEDTGEVRAYFPVVSKYGPIPLAEYPYDSKFPSGFAIDVDLKVALDQLSTLNSTIDVISGKGKEIIESLKTK
jgi:hypothetical protein